MPFIIPNPAPDARIRIATAAGTRDLLAADVPASDTPRGHDLRRLTPSRGSLARLREVADEDAARWSEVRRG